MRTWRPERLESTEALGPGEKRCGVAGVELARYFGSRPEFWLNLQSTYDLQSASRERAESILREVRPRDAA